MSIAKAYIIGLTIALTIGPISLLIVQRCIRNGLKSAAVTSAGIALADGTFAILAFSLGASILMIFEQYEFYVHFYSAVVLLGLALYILQSGIKVYRKGISIKAAGAAGGDFVSAYLLTMHNPMTVVVFMGFLSYMTGIDSIRGVILFALLLALGSYTGQLIIGLTAYVFRGFFSHPKAFLLFDCISAAGITAFALISLSKIR